MAINATASGESLSLAPASQGLKPPANPVGFTSLVCGLAAAAAISAVPFSVSAHPAPLRGPGLSHSPT